MLSYLLANCGSRRKVWLSLNWPPSGEAIGSRPGLIPAEPCKCSVIGFASLASRFSGSGRRLAGWRAPRASGGCPAGEVKGLAR